MTYLDLVNEVLKRLRENTINSTTFDSTPFYRVISTCVNDAKTYVENAWEWHVLRGEDEISMVVDQEVITIPNSSDNSYLPQSVLLKEKGVYLKYKPDVTMKERYRGDGVTAVSTGQPAEWGNYYAAATTNNSQIRVYPPPDSTDTLVIEYTKHQDPLSAFDDVLKVPAIPVYAYATALASRERGELGGAPVSELFTLADRYLSDAIARDANRSSEEEDWFNYDNPINTNHNTSIY